MGLENTGWGLGQVRDNRKVKELYYVGQDLREALVRTKKIQARGTAIEPRGRSVDQRLMQLPWSNIDDNRH